MSLLVDIQKDFQGFKLEMQLETNKEVLGILGESGSGKSMTLRCIAGIEKPDSGTIILNGKTLFDSRKGVNLPPRKRNVGLMFQNYALFPHMTVAQNIASGIQDKHSQPQIKKFMELLHLEGLESRYPKQLSGGQQQRVALARMMAAQPDVLLLDEPFSALDGRLRREIEPDFTAALKKFDGPVVFVSHSFHEVYRFSTRTAVVSDGKKVEEGDTKSLFAHPKKLTTAKLLCCPNLTKLDRTGFASGWNMQFDEVDCQDAAWAGVFGEDVELSREAENGVPVRMKQINEGVYDSSVQLEIVGAPESLQLFCSKSMAEKAAQLSAQGNLFAKIPYKKILFLKE